MGKNLGISPGVSPTDTFDLSIDQWHQRFTNQASWSKDLRKYLFQKCELAPGDRILEVGSGTGAVINQLVNEIKRFITGVDIDHDGLSFSQHINPESFHVQADGHILPFADQTFTVSLCHFLLLWVKNPIQVLYEMSRVTNPGGCIMALAEPDHQARIDYPPPLDQLGQQQTRALKKQGADIAMGRQINRLFNQIGLEKIEAGIISAQWTRSPGLTADETEWLMLRSDLAGEITADELTEYRELDAEARENGERILYIPTFYAIGFVPK